MSASPAAFKGLVVVHVRMKAKPGRANELEAALLGVRDSVLSDAEPGGIAFRVCRHDDEFLLFEEYKNVAALGPHAKTPAFLNLGKVGAECRDGDPIVLFFEEVLPKARL